MENTPPVGRFAPTPSGRMHLGNVFSFLIAWLAAKSQGGSILLRMEDLDTQRTSAEYARQIEEDLLWLGLTWDDRQIPQSQNTRRYNEIFAALQEKDLLYPCYCTRSRLHSADAPHRSDGTYVYPGTCRDLGPDPRFLGKPHAWRVKVPAKTYGFRDLLQGDFSQDIALDCGDFVVRRADGVYVYQLAVVADDGDGGVTQVVRGVDLLASAPRQMYLQEILGFQTPQYGHVPLLLAPDGRRLSKRDRDLDLGQLRRHLSAQEILGSLAATCGLIDRKEPVSARELAAEFSWEKVKKEDIFLDGDTFFP